MNIVTVKHYPHFTTTLISLFYDDIKSTGGGTAKP